MPIQECPFPDCDYATTDVSDALAVTLLQMHCTGVHMIPNTAASTNVKVEKVRRPTLSSGGSSEEWSYFLTRWHDYKDATKITGKELVIQLLECCDEELRKDLTRAAGGSLTGQPEEHVLAAIKRLAVREENIMVARVALHEMHQDHMEPIRSFGARIKGQATICKFLLSCPQCEAEVNYTDQILRDVLVKGIADADIQLDILGESNQDMSLEDLFRYIEAKESGKRSATKLSSQSINSAKSQYRRIRNDKAKDKTDTSKTNDCGYCGKTGHGKNAPPDVRKKECPAYNKKCSFCHRLHHIEVVCRSKEKFNDGENAVFDSLCSTSNHTPNSIILDHHTYNDINDCWDRRASKPQPFVTISIRISNTDYKRFGIYQQENCITVKIDAMADTGCQSCLVGLKIIRKFGITRDQLIPVTMRMHAANNNGITILGAVFLLLIGKTSQGEPIETRQLTYVSNDTDKLFLSREACVKLGLIPPSFPTIGEAFHINESTIQAIEKPNTTNDQCSCERRQLPPPKPTKLPVLPDESNREILQNWLLHHYRSSTFNTCTHQPLPMMEGPPLRFMIKSDATPVAHHKPIPVPLHWQDEIKAGLDEDVRLGVIEPVAIGEPVTWCHQMVICAKRNGKPRRTVDFQALNKYAIRETHHTQSPFHQARLVPKDTKKSVFDCWNGYHSIPLHPDDRHYTTFITPWGRYRYKVAPQGYIASGDGYTRRFDEIVAHVPDKTKCIDDTLLWSINLENSFWQAVDWLDICGRNGITLNPEKFIFGADTVSFAGFEISPDGVRPSHRYIDAIKNFPSPRNITDVRSWFGVINQVSYAFASASKMMPFRHLLKPDCPFYWNEDLERLFQESKLVIAKEIEKGVAIFDTNKITCLVTDWSKTGIGFWLLQKHCHCKKVQPLCCETGWVTTLVGSRFTQSNEENYAPIEGEALAVADGLHRTRFFVLGCKELIVAVDHKPLLKIFGDRSLNDIENPRLRNLKEKTLQFQFKMLHLPGAKIKAVDTFSRYPSGNQTPEIHLSDDIAAMQMDTTLEEDLRSTAAAALSTFQVVTWDKIKHETNSDPQLLNLMKLIQTGIPNQKSDVPHQLHDYFPHRKHLWTVDGVILYKNRIVIPPSLQQTILESLHAAHQSISNMTARAESSVFWPGITKAINSTREKCQDCNRIAPSQPNPPPTAPILPEYPFQCIAADYFQHIGNHYLVAVDRYSNWPIIEKAAGGSKGLINVLRRMFSTFGIPDELASDGGPEFTSGETDKFLQSWGVHHRISSVAYPHSNSRAEIGVKTLKRLIMSNTGPNGSLDTNLLQRAILQYRNCPDPQTKLSPAMCVFGRPTKDFIPVLPGRYEPHPTWQDTLATREDALRNRHMRAEERLSLHTRRLPPLVVGDCVRIQNQIGTNPNKWDKTGVVIEVKQFDQYAVRVDGSGRITLRNRKFLRKYSPYHNRPAVRSVIEDLRYLPATSTKINESITPALVKPARDIQATPAANADHHEPLVNTNKGNLTPIDINVNGVPIDNGLDNVLKEVPVNVVPNDNDGPTPKMVKSNDTSNDVTRNNAPNPPAKKMPLALRRLMDFNKKGLKE